jgi:hypothetical protein
MTIIVGAVIVLGGFLLFSNINGANSNGLSSKGKTLVKLKQGAPSFTVLLPSGKTLNDLDARTNDGGQPLFFFSDKISQSNITVSQQPLPDAFKSNIDKQMEILAKNSGANDKITVGNTTAFIARPTQGLENVIFTKNNLLVYIKTSAQITNEQWAQYISSLQ